MDNKFGGKSRREQRKEARLLKNKKKFDSWIEHQKFHKVKESSRDLNPKNVKEPHISSVQFPKEREIMEGEIVRSYLDDDRDNSFEQFASPMNSEVKLDSQGFHDTTASKAVGERKISNRDKKTKFEEYLQMEMKQGAISAEEDLKLERKLAKKLKVKDGKLGGLDDDINMLFEGIPSVLDSFAEEAPRVYRETSKKKSSNGSSASMKQNKLISLEKEPEGGGEMENETEELYNPVETCNISDSTTEKPIKMNKFDAKLVSAGNFDSAAKKAVKRKKTKFEKYLEIDMQDGVVSSESDLYMERELAKKLKVKEGKLRGDDDGINLLIEGIPSFLDSSESEEVPNEKVSRDSSNNTSPNKKHKKMETTEHQQAAESVGDPEVIVSETLETAGDRVASGKASSKAPELKGGVKYIAPRLRSHLVNELEEHSQIRRRVRGLLNRLSESNVESITGEMSVIFRSVARGISSQIIIEEVLASCSGGPRGNEQYAAVFAAFVAGMACLVGIDFGAKILASLAKCFEDEYLEEDNLSLRNLTLLLSYLYVFGVCSSDLIFDFMIMLSKRLMEIDVSTILTILQCCGMNLRGDDPAAMKNFVLTVQNRSSELKASFAENERKTSSKRMEFMLETICDIKNNKKRAKEDTSQHTRIKKWLQKLRVEDILVRGLKWSKLLDPDKKGQWWLTGDMASVINNVEEVASTIDKESLEAQKMLQLAARQRMNTDVRRAIFCIIMSGEDYIDAFEKLLRLDLQGKQDREIMRVLVECCLQEKVFNKYYSVLATKLCSHDKKHKVTLQYCIWDHYKQLESMELMRSMHLSKFVAEMISSFTLSLAVLKSVDFNDAVQLTPKRTMHFRMLFETMFEFSDSLIWNVFTRIAANPEYESLRNGIEYVINKYVSGIEKSPAQKVKIAKKALANIEGVLM